MTFPFLEEDELTRQLSLFLKRITYGDAYRRTDCGFTEENRKTQAYRFLDGIADMEKSLSGEKRNIQIREERARDLSLFLKRITYDDAYRRTDCGFTEEKKKAQAYLFLDGVAAVEKSLDEEISRQPNKKNQENQGIKR